MSSGYTDQSENEDFPGTWAADLAKKIEAMVPPTTMSGKPGFILSDKPLSQYDQRREVPALISVQTLSGIIDLLEHEGIQHEDVMLQVCDHATVRVVAKHDDDFGRRYVLAKAEMPKLAEFQFGQWYPSEEFVIGLLTLFAPESVDRDYVISTSKKIVSGETIVTADDGISQTVVIQSGAALKTPTKLNNRVHLSPFRTFREVLQPSSEFVFRVKRSNDGSALLSLIESDGGAWRLHAMESIRSWLLNALQAQGCGEIPVIA